MHVLIATDGSPQLDRRGRARPGRSCAPADHVTLLSVRHRGAGRRCRRLRGFGVLAGRAGRSSGKRRWRRRARSSSAPRPRSTSADRQADRGRRRRRDRVPGRRRARRRRDRRRLARPRRDRAILLGSVSEQVVRHAPCPVLVVRPTPEPEAMPSRSVASSLPGPAVALAVRVLGERRAPRRAERAGRMAERARARPASTCSGSPRIACISARNPVVIVVSALPSPSAVAASSRFCTAGKIDDGIVASSPRCTSAHTTMFTGASATPPVAPRRRRRASPGVSRVSENARPCASHARRDRSPSAARVAASRTTTNSHGCLFSALGANVAAVSMRAIVSSSTGSVAERPARALARDDVEEVVAHRASLARRRGRTSSRT